MKAPSKKITTFRNLLKRAIAGLLLIVVLLVPYKAEAYEDIDPCTSFLLVCLLACVDAGPLYPLCAAACGVLWVGCKIFSVAFVGESNIQGGTATLATGYLLTTNSLGVAPVNLTVARWDGTNASPATTITNVDFYCIPKDLLSGYSSTNYGQAPWSYIGPGTLNTNTGFWSFSWVPASYTNYLLLATMGDSINGAVSAATWARPQWEAPGLAAASISAASFKMELVGPVGRSYHIQTSPDALAWTDFLSITNFTGQGQITDSATNQHEFYRVLMQ